MSSTSPGGRNFRAKYLTSVGIRDPQLRRTIEKLLHDDFYVDIAQLRSIGAQHHIPDMFRADMWCMLLGVLTNVPESWADIREQNRARFYDFKNTAQFLGPGVEPQSTQRFGVGSGIGGGGDGGGSGSGTSASGGGGSVGDRSAGSADGVAGGSGAGSGGAVPAAERERDDSEHERRVAEVMVLLYRIHVKYMEHVSIERSSGTAVYRADVMTKTASVFLSVLATESDAYWCMLNFCKLRGDLMPSEQSHEMLQHLRALTETLLETNEHNMLLKLRSLGVNGRTVADGWLRSFFASVLPKHDLVLLWDKVFCCSVDFLVCMVVAYLQCGKVQLVRVKTRRELRAVIAALPRTESFGRALQLANEVYREHSQGASGFMSRAPLKLAVSI